MDRQLRKPLAAALHLRGQAELAADTVARLKALHDASPDDEALIVKLTEATRAAEAAEAAALAAEAAASAVGDVGPLTAGPTVNAHADVARGTGAAG